MPKGPKHFEKRVALRLSGTMHAKIEKLIAEGKYRKLSQVVRAALEKFLDDKN